MWKALAPQPGLYRHWPEDPHWTGPVLRAQERVAQGCGQGFKQGKQCFIPPRKEVTKTLVSCCTLTSRCSIYASKQKGAISFEPNYFKIKEKLSLSSLHTPPSLDPHHKLWEPRPPELTQLGACRVAVCSGKSQEGLIRT